MISNYNMVYGQNNKNIRTRFGSLKPVLGWTSWSFIRKDPSAEKIEAQAHALVESGLAKFGYKFVNIDDFWYKVTSNGEGPAVDSYGRWVPDPSRFPDHGNTNGIKAVVNYVHSLGLKFGIYITPGISMQAVIRNTPIEGTPYTAGQIADTSIKESNYNCGGMVAIDFKKRGAQEYINSWAAMFANWGIDFIKLDGVSNGDTNYVKAWSKALEKIRRLIVLDITQGTYTQVIAPVLMKYADQWEYAPDIECYSCDEKTGSSFPLTQWKNVASRFLYATVWQRYSMRGGYNDYDAIEVGNGSNTGLTPDERQTQLSLWALESAPLLIGADLTHLDFGDKELLENTEMLAVDQDGIAAKRFLVPFSNQPVFAKMESDGAAVIGLFNIDSSSKEVSIQATAVGLPFNKKGYSTYNIWTGKRSKVNGNISELVPPHGVAFLRVKVVR